MNPARQLSNSTDIFRKKYEGRTLEENLGLQRARNRFFEPVDAVSAAEQPFSAYLPLPGISGAILRIFYSFMVPIFGGRLWTTLATWSLMIPALSIVITAAVWLLIFAGRI